MGRGCVVGRNGLCAASEAVHPHPTGSGRQRKTRLKDDTRRRNRNIGMGAKLKSLVALSFTTEMLKDVAEMAMEEMSSLAAGDRNSGVAVEATPQIPGFRALAPFLADKRITRLN